MTSPELSVVVTVVDGLAALEVCLTALADQVDKPAMEVIVPYDETIAEVVELADRFPGFRFVSLGAISDDAAPDNAFAEHVLLDLRRAAGLRLAQSPLVGMVEDRGVPHPDWARTMVELHDALPHAVIGGAIESGATTVWLSAAYFCDYGRYQPPFESDEPDYVTDINICYKREALEAVRPVWEKSYQEASVNWAIQEQGHRLHLSDKPVVVQRRRPLGVRRALSERVHWGRIFGQVRGRENARWKCLLWAAATPVLPSLLFARQLKRQRALPKSQKEFRRAAPAILLLLHLWAVGECVGYCEAAFGRRD